MVEQIVTRCRTEQASLDCLKGRETSVENLKVIIGGRKYKRFLIISKKKLQRLSGDLYHTVPPNNSCLLCGPD